MRSHFLVEFARAFFRKEDSGALEFHPSRRSRDRSFQPIGPLEIEKHVVRSPRNERGCLHEAERYFNIDGVAAIERVDEPLQVMRTLRRTEMRPQVDLDGIVGDSFRMLVR